VGASFDPNDDDAPITAINITPMVDIMLVLLIIFMVTASIINAPSIKVELPDAATGEETETTNLGITLDPESNWYVNGEATTEDGIRALIKSEQDLGNEIQVAIAADKVVPHGEVVKVIDVVRQEGVTKFAINIDHAMATAPAEELPPETPAD
jgi:biopolymer transport protein ExbD